MTEQGKLMNDEDLFEALTALSDMKKTYAESKAKFEKQTCELKQLIDALEKDITEAVLAKGESFGTTQIIAIWNKGRTTWDSKLLEGYAMAHPDILGARKIGEPTVSFRLLK